MVELNEIINSMNEDDNTLNTDNTTTTPSDNEFSPDEPSEDGNTNEDNVTDDNESNGEVAGDNEESGDTNEDDKDDSEEDDNDDSESDANDGDNSGEDIVIDPEFSVDMEMQFTTFQSLYDRVLANLPEEYKLGSMDDETLEYTLYCTLLPAIASFHNCKANLNDRNDELKQFNFELSNDEFIILTNYMTINYIDSNYIRVPTALELSLTSKDFHSFSPANHLAVVKDIREMYVDENEAMCMKYSMRHKMRDLIEKEDNDRGRKRIPRGNI